MLVGRTEFTLACREFPRHVVEGGSERRKFRRPIFGLGADIELAASDARGRARERADRLDDQFLAPEPSGEQGQEAEEDELKGRNADLAIDPAENFLLVESHHHTGVRSGYGR